MAERGRPKVLDQVKKDYLCGMVSWGCPRRVAVKYVDISQSTLYRAAKEDKALAERLRQSEMAAEMEPLRRMQEHSRHSWRAMETKAIFRFLTAPLGAPWAHRRRGQKSAPLRPGSAVLARTNFTPAQIRSPLHAANPIIP